MYMKLLLILHEVPYKKNQGTAGLQQFPDSFFQDLFSRNSLHKPLDPPVLHKEKSRYDICFIRRRKCRVFRNLHFKKPDFSFVFFFYLFYDRPGHRTFRAPFFVKHDYRRSLFAQDFFLKIIFCQTKHPVVLSVFPSASGIQKTVHFLQRSMKPLYTTVSPSQPIHPAVPSGNSSGSFLSHIPFPSAIYSPYIICRISLNFTCLLSTCKSHFLWQKIFPRILSSHFPHSFPSLHGDSMSFRRYAIRLLLPVQGKRQKAPGYPS